MRDQSYSILFTHQHKVVMLCRSMVKNVMSYTNKTVFSMFFSKVDNFHHQMASRPQLRLSLDQVVIDFQLISPAGQCTLTAIQLSNGSN